MPALEPTPEGVLACYTREAAIRRHGAQMRVARAYGRSHTWVQEMLAKARDTLEYVPPPYADEIDTRPLPPRDLQLLETLLAAPSATPTRLQHLQVEPEMQGAIASTCVSQVRSRPLSVIVPWEDYVVLRDGLLLEAWVIWLGVIVAGVLTGWGVVLLPIALYAVHLVARLRACYHC